LRIYSILLSILTTTPLSNSVVPTEKKVKKGKLEISNETGNQTIVTSTIQNTSHKITHISTEPSTSGRKL
jgi:hypothetical protein